MKSYMTEQYKEREADPHVARQGMCSSKRSSKNLTNSWWKVYFQRLVCKGHSRQVLFKKINGFFSVIIGKEKISKGRELSRILRALYGDMSNILQLIVNGTRPILQRKKLLMVTANRSMTQYEPSESPKQVNVIIDKIIKTLSLLSPELRK